MTYQRDIQKWECHTCRRTVRLVRCAECKGSGGGGWVNDCKVCNQRNSRGFPKGYNCENNRGLDRYHNFR